jgi:hypothetical protein
MIKSSTRKFRRAGEPGTLGAVCKVYFDKPKHEGCPFQRVCLPGNLPVETGSSMKIVRSADAQAFEEMAQAIRATEEER